MADGKKALEDVKHADQLRLSGEYEKSIELLEVLTQEQAFFAPAKLSLGRAYFEFGKLKDAATILEEYVEFVPEHILANKILARIYVHEKKFDQARIKIKKVLIDAPDDIIAQRLLQELTPDSMESLDQDDTVKTTAPALTSTMAELYYHQGHIEEARKIYEKLLAHDPQNITLQEKLRNISKEGENVAQKKSVSPAVEQVLIPASEKGNSAVEKLEGILQKVQERKK